MNRNKIKSMLLMMGTVVSLNLGSQIDVKAIDIDKDQAALEEKQRVEKTEVNTESYEAKKSLASTAPTVQQVEASVNKINAGEGKISDYRNLKVLNLNINNIDCINKAVELQKNDKNADLTKDEIKETAEDAKNVYNLMEKVRDGSCTSEDFYSVKVYNIDNTNLEEVCSLIREKELYRSKEVQNDINKIIGAKERVSKGEADLQDYSILGIDGVTSENIKQVNDAVKEKSSQRGTILPVAEAKQTAEAEIIRLQKIVLIRNGQAVPKDYEELGVTGVTEDNLISINDALKGRDLNTVLDVQNAVNAEIKVLQSVKNICSGKGIVTDFKNIGIESVTEDNIERIRKDIEGKGLSTIKEIKDQVAKTLEDLMEYKIKSIESGDAASSDYSAIGILGVDTENCGFINENVKGVNYGSIDEVRTAVSRALEKFAASKRINNGEGTVSDYALLDKPEVTEDKLKFVNDQIKAQKHYNYSYSSIRSDIQDALETYDSYVKINEGAGTLDDYHRIGVTNIKDEYLGEVNTNLKGKNYFESYKIKNVVNQIDTEQTAIKNIDGGYAVIGHYTDLGINTVNNENYKFINEVLKGHNYTKKLDVQKACIDAVEIYSAALRIRDGVSSGLSDFTNKLGCSEVNEENIDFVSKYVKGTSTNSYVNFVDKIKNAVEVYDAILRVKRGTASLQDYNNLFDIKRVTINNYEYIKLNLQGRDFKTVEDVKAAVNIALDRKLAIERVNSGTATVNDYTTYLGIDVVNDDNRVFINDYIKNNDFTEVAHVQTAVNKAIVIYDKVCLINKGEASAKDFADIEVEGITDSNYHYVNSYCKYNGTKNLKELKNRIQKAVKEYTAITKINTGAAEVSSYADIGIVEVKAANCDYINTYLRNYGFNFKVDSADVDSETLKKDIQSAVNTANTQYLLITKINDGSAVLSDYQNLFINGVSVKNIDYVNSYVKNRNLKSIEKVQEVVNLAVNEFDAILHINSGTATVQEYRDVLGTQSVHDPKTGEMIEEDYVTIDNLDYINRRISNNVVRYGTCESVKLQVEQYIAAFKLLKKIQGGSAEVKDYTDFGLNGVEDKNNRYINSCLSGTTYETTDQLQALINVAKEQYSAMERINEGTAELDNYKTIGIVDDVNSNNKDFINGMVKGSNLFTIEEVKNKVSKAVDAYKEKSKIENGEGVIDTYAKFGITSVNLNNVSYINDNLKGVKIDDSATLILKANALAEQFTHLININDGEGKVDDYQRLGITDVNESNLNYVNLKNINKDFYKKGKSAIEELSRSTTLAVIEFNRISRINAGTATEIDYKSLGIQIQPEAVDYVNTNICGNNYKSVELILAKVNELNTLFISFNKINNGIGLTADYQALGINRVTDEIVAYVNADLKGKNLMLSSKMDSYIESNMNIYAALKMINDGNAEISEYKTIGVVSNIEGKVDLLNVKFKGCNVYTKDEARKLAEKYSGQGGAYDNIRKGNGTLDDYKTAEIDGITADNLDYVNSQIAGRIDAYGSNIQSEVNSVLALYNAVNVINNGQERNNDEGYVAEFYEICKIKVKYDTTSDSEFDIIKRRIALERKIKNNTILNKEALTQIINDVLSRYEDYKVLMNEIDKNLEIQAKAQGSDLTSDEVKKTVESVDENIKNVIKRVSTGLGSLSDFNFLGETQLTQEEVYIINADILDGRYIKCLSEYRLDKNSFNNALNNGMAIESINRGTESSEYDEFRTIGIGMNYDESNNSIYSLVKKVIKLRKECKGDNLTRDDITKIVTEVTKDRADLAAIIDKVIQAVESAKAEKKGSLKPEEEEAVIKAVKDDRKARIARVQSGKDCTIEDFKYFGELRVNKDNLEAVKQYINTINPIRILGEYRLSGLESAVSSGIAFYNINNSIVEDQVRNFNLIGININDTSTDLIYYKLIDEEVKLERRKKNGAYLSVNDLSIIVNRVLNHYDDEKYILPKINEKINASEEEGEILQGDKVIEIADSVAQHLKEICRKVISGSGEIKDFKELGIDNINEETLKIINRDISENRTVSSLGSYRVNNLERAVADGLAIYYVNSNEDSDAASKLSTILGTTIIYSQDQTSLFKLVCSKIKIERALNENKYLSRQDINKILSSINDDSNVIIPKVLDAIKDAENKKKQTNPENSSLTSEEVQKIQAETENKIQKVCYDIANGEGSVEEFAFFGKTEVNEQNIDIINTDIKAVRLIKQESIYRLSGLDEAIKRGIDIYSINNNCDESVAVSFSNIGVKDALYSTSDTSKFKLMCYKIRIKRNQEDGRYLSRKEILDLEKEIDSKLEDEKVIIPRVIERINELEKANKGERLSKDETNKAIKDVKAKIVEVCSHVASGTAGVDEYRYLGENRVDDDNITVINRDIQKYKRVGLPTSYRVTGLEKAVDLGLDLYTINTENSQNVEKSFGNLSTAESDPTLAIKYSTIETDLFNLVHSRIEIERALKNNDFLTRGEIIGIIKDVLANKEDLIVLIPLENKALKAAKAENDNKDLTKEQVESTIAQVEKQVADRCARVLNGTASADDYLALGAEGVNKDNVDVINANNKNVVIKLTNFRLGNLDEAVKLGLIVYRINNNNDSQVIKDFQELGIKNLTYSSNEKSEFALIEAKMDLFKRLNNKAALTKDEILKVVQDVRDNFADYVITIPQITKAIKEEETKNNKKMTSSEVENKILEVENNIKEICSRVVNGEGTLNDYEYFGETRVNKDNLKIINNDIKVYGKDGENAVKLKTLYSVEGLKDAVTNALGVYNINYHYDKNIVNYINKFGETNIKYSAIETSQFVILQSQIDLQKRIKNRCLDRGEIIELIGKVKDSDTYEDLKIVIPKITEAVKRKEAESNTKLMGADLQNLIVEVQNKISEVCNNILGAKASVEDFRYLGETRVTEANIKTINSDIKANGTNTLILKSNYRIEGLEKVVSQGLAVYTINNSNNETVVKCLKDLEYNDIPYSSEPTSLFQLIYSKIQLERKLNGGAELNRTKILEVIDYVKANEGDLKSTLPAIMSKIEEAEQGGKSLSNDEINNIVNGIQNDVEGICARIKAGKATIEDYRYFGEKRVDDKNLKIVNREIYNSHSISLTTNFTIGGLTEAVDKALAVYNLNLYDNKTVEKDLKELTGEDIAYSTDTSSLFSLITAKIRIARKLVDNEFISRDDILDIIKDVKENEFDLAVYIPTIDKQLKETQDITKEDVKNIIEKAKLDAQKLCKDIYEGHGSVEEFKALGELRVNEDNIKVVNADLHNVLIKLSAYRLENLKEAVDKGLAVYNINTNKNDDTTLPDFTALGLEVKADGSETSLLRLVESEVRFDKLIKGDYLTREEIKIAYDRVLANVDDEKVFVPYINKKLGQLSKEPTKEETFELIKKAKAEITSICQRVSRGDVNVTVSDFNFFNEHRVTESNIEAVRQYIYDSNSVTMSGNYHVKNLSEAVKIGISIYDINEGSENFAETNFSNIGISITKDTEETSLFKLVQSDIAIQRRIKKGGYLTKAEILELVRKVEDNLEDYKVLIPAIKRAINSAEQKANKPLDAGEVENLCNNVKDEWENRIVAICGGSGTVEDFRAIGEKRVDSNNIDLVNAEIISTHPFTKASKYRVNPIDKALDYILDIYAINIGSETEKHDTRVITNSCGDIIRRIDSNYRVKEYESLGKKVLWDSSSNSELSLIKQAIQIMRMQKGGAYLSRNEIINDVIDKIEQNFEDSKMMIPLIYKALIDEQITKKGSLTIEEVNKVIEDKKNYVSSAVDKIIAGHAKIEDYALFGNVKVDERIIDILNEDVRAHGGIYELSKYRIAGLDDEVNAAMALYDINNLKVDKSSNDYALIGINIEYSDDVNSLFKIFEDYIQIRKYETGLKNLSRDELLKDFEYVSNNLDDERILVPEIKARIDKVIVDEKVIETNRVAQIISDVENERKELIDAVCMGRGTVQNFKDLGEKRVNDGNIEAVNAAIRSRRDKVITNEGKYRIKGLTKQVDQAIAVNRINNELITNSSGKAKEFKDLGIDVDYSNKDTSELRIIQDFIIIRKREDGNFEYSKEDIIKLVNEVRDNFDMYKIIVPIIYDQIVDYEDENDKVISSEDANNIDIKTRKELTSRVKRIIKGSSELTIEDFRCYGEKRVDSHNIYIVINEINKYKDVEKENIYSVSGLTEAVDKALAVYNLNEEIESVSAEGYVKEYAALGFDNIKRDKSNDSLDQAIMKYINVMKRIGKVENAVRDAELVPYVTRDTIIDGINKLQKNEKVEKARIDRILKEISDADDKNGSPINIDAAKAIYERILSEK